MNYLYSELIYIYFIYIDRKLVYIGRSATPLKRIANHRGRFLKDIETYKVVVHGPYEKWNGYDIECNEIKKRKHLKHFLAITNKYGHTKKISVKNYGSKTVLYFGKRGKVEKMVSEYPNK